MLWFINILNMFFFNETIFSYLLGNVPIILFITASTKKDTELVFRGHLCVLETLLIDPQQYVQLLEQHTHVAIQMMFLVFPPP